MPEDDPCQLLLPQMPTIQKIHLGNQALNALLATGMALHAYRLEQGKYPSTLAALIPGYLPVVPSDPFADGPLHYRASGASFLLYSVGPDGKDDGGRPIFDGLQHPVRAPGDYDLRYAVQQDSKGDIVAGLNF